MELMKKDLIMTSLEVAEITDKEHKNVLADIRSEIESIEKEGLSTELIFKLSDYKDSTGRKLPMHTMGREGVMQIATRYSAAIRRKLIIKKLSKVGYICKVLKKGGLLIEIMAKVFEIPTEDIIGKYKDYEFDDTREIILIDGSDY